MNRKIVGLTVLVTLLTILISGLVNIMTGQGVFTHLSFLLVGGLLVLFTIALVLATIFSDRLRVDSSSTRRTLPPPSLPSPRERENRQRLLARVRDTWIGGVLNRSLYREARIVLNLEEQPDALADPWQLSLHRQGQPAQPLPAGTRIIEVYDHAHGELLILGEPGSGKTTLLLELTQTLLSRAQRDETHPLPVVFSLSSWASKQQSLPEWLIEELYTKYQVPRSLGQVWVYNDQLFPLLDGLDEVVEAQRLACIEVINAYRREHGSLPTVVCSRTIDYVAQAGRLQLQNAVVVQPLTETQIEAYLKNAGPQFAIVQAALHDDAILHELVTTPLMLSILTLAYQGQHIEKSILAGSLEARRQQLFETYVRRMLERHSAGAHYAQQHTQQWLHWLAVQLGQHNQTEFYLEELQPNWLPRAAIFRLVCGILTGLVSGLVFGLSFGLGGGLVFGLFNGLIVGVFYGLLEELESDKSPTEITNWSWVKQERDFRFQLSIALSVGLVGGLVGGLIGGLIGELVGGLGFSWAFVLLSLLGGGYGGELALDISPTEIITWSWVELQQNLPVGLIVGLIVGLFYGLVGGLIGGLFFALVGGLIGGLNILEKNERLIPNQGMRRSAQNSLRVGLVFGLVGGLFSGLVGGLSFGLVGGLSFGLVFGLVFGGFACLQHSILRLFLWQAGYAPLRYVHFLDYATRCILLRRVGGGYIFIHRMLLDFFASQESMLLLTKAGKPAQNTAQTAHDDVAS